tara:strand:+ start:216 stop:1001 length:786 start_codon:yes stop_codon:yes gene_type:complete
MTENNYFERNGSAYLSLENDEIFLGYGELSNSPENFLIKSNTLEYYDYLIFMDSRGAKVEKNAISSIELLRSYFEKMNFSYLIISRPLNLTTVATFLSFLDNTIIKFGKVVTNVGFVDTTPKKINTLLDIKSQLDGLGIDYQYQNLGDFKLSNGINEELGTFSISENSINAIAKKLKKINSKLYFINTPEVLSNKGFTRNRPECFYSQINKSNELVKKISGESSGNLIDISKVGVDTFDGVHFTDIGHKICYKMLLGSLTL